MGPEASNAATEQHFEVRSDDGTPLAVWVAGSGPALVMVHGSIADHTTFDAFIEVLRTGFTTYAMDRRGFGASGDAQDYSIDREFFDVAAVIEAVAARTGEAVAVWGHSYGANCALGGAASSRNVSHLILYEPSLGLKYPPGSIEGIEAALSRGDNEAAIVAVLRDALELAADEIEVFRSSPLWPVRVAAAPTVARECHAEEDWVYTEGRFDSVMARTLLLTGSESVEAIVEATRRAAEAVPGAQVRVLPGHAHFAHRTDPEMVRDIISSFLAS